MIGGLLIYWGYNVSAGVDNQQHSLAVRPAIMILLIMGAGQLHGRKSSLRVRTGQLWPETLDGGSRGGQGDGIPAMSGVATGGPGFISATRCRRLYAVCCSSRSRSPGILPRLPTTAMLLTVAHCVGPAGRGRHWSEFLIESTTSSTSHGRHCCARANKTGARPQKPEHHRVSWFG